MTTTQPDISAFTRLGLASAGDLQSLREAGMRRFQAVGLPRANEEESRFTNTDPLAEVKWQLPTVTPQAAELCQPCHSRRHRVGAVQRQASAGNGHLPRASMFAR